MKVLRYLTITVAVAFGLLGAGYLANDRGGYRGEPLHNFDGWQFQNLVPIQDKGLADLLRWQFNREPGPWAWRDTPVRHEPLPEPPSGHIQVSFVNQATVLIQVDGVNILTDPIWSERAGPYFGFAGAPRYHPPGLTMEALPPIDLVLISHNHYDHLDVPSLRALEERFKPRFVVGLGNGDLLRKAGIAEVVELNWWESVTEGEIEIVSMPVQHASMRIGYGYDRTLWAGYVVRTRHGPIVFAGDTGYGPQFSMARERFGPARLAILPIGSYLPRWFMRDNHMSPADALKASDDLAAEFAMAIHFGTFRVADDGQDQAPTELAGLLSAGQRPIDFWIPAPGETRHY